MNVDALKKEDEKHAKTCKTSVSLRFWEQKKDLDFYCFFNESADCIVMCIELCMPKMMFLLITFWKSQM